MSLAAKNTVRNVAPMENWNDLAKAKMKKLKITQEALAEQLGVTQGAVAHWLGGRREPDLATINKVLGFLGLPMLSVGDQSQAEEKEAPSDKEYALIPQYSAKGKCGDGYLNDHVEVSGGLAFKRDWLARMKARPENLFVIYADGDSMEPYIFEGDVVMFDKSDLTIRDRKVYAIRRPDGGVSIKRIIQQVSGAWLIRSDNPDKLAYPDEPVSEKVLHDMPILGRVIWRGGGIG